MTDDGYGEVKYRAQHSTLIFEELRGRRGAGRWRDGFSSYLDKILSEEGLFEAAQKLRAGWMIQTVGLGFVSSDPFRIPGNIAQGSKTEELLEAYTRWYKAVTLAHGARAVLMCLEVVCYGQTLNETDTKRAQKHGTAKENMVMALGLYERTAEGK